MRRHICCVVLQLERPASCGGFSFRGGGSGAAVLGSVVSSHHLPVCFARRAGLWRALSLTPGPTSATAGDSRREDSEVGESPRGFVPFRSLRSYENLLNLQQVRAIDSLAFCVDTSDRS